MWGTELQLSPLRSTIDVKTSACVSAEGLLKAEKPTASNLDNNTSLEQLSPQSQWNAATLFCWELIQMMRRSGGSMTEFRKLSRDKKSHSHTHKKRGEHRADCLLFFYRNVCLKTIRSSALDTGKIPIDCFIKVMNSEEPHWASLPLNLPLETGCGRWVFCELCPYIIGDFSCWVPKLRFLWSEIK